ncbi:MAG: TonB family protein [Archangium sp.]|nr:TonB family protein [Archangium sp.]MDP3154677.1 TonB family protein [Archangium sp.]MDP3572695.1 TonB family protein [Archangium sp.]
MSTEIKWTMLLGVIVASAALAESPPTPPTPPIVTGSLDKALIREVIQRNRSQIRYCYDKQLLKSPTLAGKVAVTFHISPEGPVSSAEVAQSTVADVELESCIVERVRTWVFPKPKGGGKVIVTYPFMFSAK